MNGRERIFNLLEGKPVDYLPCMPITMQFAAVHYGVDYLDYATNYRLLTDAQMAVAEAYDLDYVNTMSDPAIEAADCGATVIFSSNAVPAMDHSNALLENKANLVTLKVPPPESGRMLNRVKAVERYKEKLGGEKVIEGWIEGPCAEAADLRGMNNIMLDLVDDPGFVKDLFEFVLQLEIAFAKAQVDAGADIIGIGDAAASLIGPRFYEQYVWPYEKRMVDAVNAMGVKTRLHICGNTKRIAEGMGKLGCHIVDLDFLTPVHAGRSAMGPDQVILGNVDPVRVLREGTESEIIHAFEACHRQAGSRYIVGPGCETPPDTPAANFKAMIRYAREHKPNPSA